MSKFFAALLIIFKIPKLFSKLFPTNYFDGKNLFSDLYIAKF